MTIAPAPGYDALEAAIGERVHTLLWHQRKPQTRLARALGLTSSVLSKKLRGESAWSARQVALAARELGVSAGQLYGETPLTPHPGTDPDGGEYFHGNEWSHRLHASGAPDTPGGPTDRYAA